MLGGMTENQRLSLNSPRTTVIPSGRYDDGLEVVIQDDPEAVYIPEPEAVYIPKLGSSDKYPVEMKSLSKWHKRKFGCSLRTYFAIAIGALLIIAVVTIVGITASHKRGSPTEIPSSIPTLSPATAITPASTTPPPSSSPSAIAATSENLALDCPSIDKQVFSNTTTALEAKENMALTGTPYQFKRFCGKKPTNSSTLALVGSDASLLQLSGTPSTQQTFEGSFECVAYNVGISDTSITFNSCEGAYFNANLSSVTSDGGANCFSVYIAGF